MKLEPQFIGVATLAACLVSPVFAQNAPVPEAPVVEVADVEETQSPPPRPPCQRPWKWPAAAKEVLARAWQ